MQTNQYRYIKQENSEWLKTLDLMNQECIQMKTRLSSLLEHNSATIVIDRAEQFQNQILLQEEAIDLLKLDLREQDLHLNQDYFRPDQIIKEDTLFKQDQIRKQIGYLETDFLQIHEAFNEYVLKYMAES